MHLGKSIDLPIVFHIIHKFYIDNEVVELPFGTDYLIITTSNCDNQILVFGKKDLVFGLSEVYTNSNKTDSLGVKLITYLPLTLAFFKRKDSLTACFFVCQFLICAFTILS